PRNQDACDPNARSDPVQYEIAGDLEQKVTNEKDSSCKAELLAGDGQLAIHRQGRKSYVDPVEESDGIEHEEERQQPDPEFPDRHRPDRVFDAVWHVHLFDLCCETAHPILYDQAMVISFGCLTVVKKARANSTPPW